MSTKKQTSESKDLALKLTIIERMSLEAIRPKEGDFATVTITRDIKKKIELSQQEIKDYSIQIMYGADNKTFIQGNEKSATYKKNIVFTELEKNILLLELKKLHESKKIDENFFDICNYFGFKG